MKVIVLLFVGLCGVSYSGVVAAQELLVAPGEIEMEGAVPDLALPPEEGEIVHEGSPGVTEEGSWEPGMIVGGELEPSPMNEYNMMTCDPLTMESTGTWIRRGFWYAEVDAVISNRISRRDPLVLIQQPVGQSSNPFVNSQIFNQLKLDGGRPGAETAPRLTLGRFLFRDRKNRDHVGEFTIYGGGEWSQEAVLNVNPNNQLNSQVLLVPVETDFGNDSFDGAQSSQFRYDSRFNSFELNYHVKDRMGRDHMELEPTGHWVRRAGSSTTRTFLAGLRFFDLNEDFDWTASGIGFDPDSGDPGQTGSVRTETDNDMLGTQLGFDWTYEAARWSLGFRAKGGMFVNFIDIRSNSIVPLADDPNNPSFNDTALQSDEVGFVGEMGGLAKWHIQPNFSLRAGFEVLYVTSVALAPNQISFVPGGPSVVVASGDPVYVGGTIGFEGYW